jgi:hypothetical protein
MTIKCEDCGKELQSRKAYAGHMLLAHGKRVGFMAEFDAKMRIVERIADEQIRMGKALAWLALSYCKRGETPPPDLYQTIDEYTGGWLSQQTGLLRSEVIFRQERKKKGG